jgi:hypothetical protein
MFRALPMMETRKRKTRQCGVPYGDGRHMRSFTPASRFDRVSCDRMHQAVGDLISQVSRLAVPPNFYYVKYITTT